MKKILIYKQQIKKEREIKRPGSRPGSEEYKTIPKTKQELKEESNYWEIIKDEQGTNSLTCKTCRKKFRSSQQLQFHQLFHIEKEIKEFDETLGDEQLKIKLRKVKKQPVPIIIPIIKKKINK